MAKDKKDTEAAHIQEHPNDPVYVPDLARVEALVNKMTQEGRSAGGLAYQDVRETICGATDDSQPVEQYDGTLGVTRGFVDQHQSPVGVLRWHTNLASHYTNPGNVAGQRWCTGTLIADNLFLTAGHCFDQTGGGWQRPRVNGSSNIISPEEIATRMNVEFDFQTDGNGVLKSPVSVGIEELIEYRLDGLDFAIVRLSGNPGQQFGTTELAADDGNVGDMICIIGHPAGQPKRIEAGPITSFDDFRVRYNDIDTLGGNSGSGILRESDGAIVGIHTNGGCNVAMTGSNFGLRITRLRAASPTVQEINPRTNRLRDVITNPLADRLTLADRDRLRTNPIQDIVHTNPINDRPTSIIADRPTHVVADRQTNPLLDNRTSPIRDRFPTSPVLDRPTSVIQDRRPTSVIQDNPTSVIRDRGTNPRDDFGTSPARDFGTSPIGDRVGLPRDGGILPRPGRGGGAQPFVMATPHHARGDMAGLAQTGGQAGPDEFDEMIDYYEQISLAIEEMYDELTQIEEALEHYALDEFGYDEFDG